MAAGQLASQTESRPWKRDPSAHPRGVHGTALVKRTGESQEKSQEPWRREELPGSPHSNLAELAWQSRSPAVLSRRSREQCCRVSGPGGRFLVCETLPARREVPARSGPLLGRAGNR